jgi:hypothetical protein
MVDILKQTSTKKTIMYKITSGIKINIDHFIAIKTKIEINPSIANFHSSLENH